MTSRSHYPPIIGDGEDTTQVKKTYGVNDNYNSSDLTPAQAGKGLFQWLDNGQVVYCDGEEFIRLTNKRYFIEKSYLVPALAAANAATYSQTGNIITVTSTGHNMTATVCNGADVYLAMLTGNAIAGWFSDFTYVDANTFTCLSTVSQSTTGTISTNTTATVTPTLITLPGGLLLSNSSIKINWNQLNNNSVDAKSSRLRINASDIAGGLLSNTTVTGTSAALNMFNFNSVIKQVMGAATFNINTVSDVNFTFGLTCAAANSFVLLAAFETKVDL